MYNVEKYIVRCLESVYNQNFDKNKFEVILIDDQSPDNSYLIAKEFLKEQTNYKIIRQENKGLGGARNTGITNASGKYVIFLDSDDILVENAMDKVFHRKYDGFEILELSCILVNEKLEISKKIEPDTLKTSKRGTEYYLNNRSIPSVCNKIYSREFLLVNNLFFKEQIYIEDFEFNTRSFFYTEKFLSDSDIILQYFVQTRGSITRNNDTNKKRKLISDIFKILNILKAFYIEKSDKNTELYFKERLSLLNINVIFQAFKYGYSRKEIKNIISELKKQDVYFLNYKVNDSKKNYFRLLVLHFFMMFEFAVYFKNERNR